MGQEIQNLINDIIDYGRLVLVAMFMIFLVYTVAKDLFGMVSATIGSIMAGLALVYIYATNKAVRNAIASWGKGSE